MYFIKDKFGYYEYSSEYINWVNALINLFEQYPEWATEKHTTLYPMYRKLKHYKSNPNSFLYEEIKKEYYLHKNGTIKTLTNIISNQSQRQDYNVAIEGLLNCTERNEEYHRVVSKNKKGKIYQ